MTGRWKRPRPEHAEGPAHPVKDPSDEENNRPQTSKRQATSAAATLAKTSTSRGTLDELEERLRNFHDSARALASCPQQPRLVSRKTDQKNIEAAKCMFPQIAGGGKGRLEPSVAAVTRRSLCRGIKQNDDVRVPRYWKRILVFAPRNRAKNRYIECHRNAIATIFSQDTGASYRGWSSEAARVVGTSVLTWRNANTNSKCRRSLRQHELALRRGGEEGARLDIFGCTLDLDQTVEA